MKFIQYVRQPRGSRLCGQACIAMIAGVGLSAAIQAVGHRHGTTTADLVRALRKLGCECPDTLSRGPLGNGIAKYRLKRRDGNHGWRSAWHWVVIWGGRIYDPAHPHRRSITEHSRHLSSWLPVKDLIPEF